jgi:hypothetical protein
VLWSKIGPMGPTCQANRPCNLVGRHCLWALDTLSTTSTRHIEKMVFGNAPTHGQPAKVMWPASHTLARLSSCFVPWHSLVSYCL